nr:hypothetical protein [Tanacetum cinerariifolium]
MSWFLRCSWCEGPFNSGNYQHCINHHVETYSCELCGNNSHYGYDCPPQESTIPLNEIVSQIPPSIPITSVLPTMEPDDSLIMWDEDLPTILEKESDEFIKSSVEDLVPIPCEFEDTSGSDSECDLPSCDHFSSINVLEGQSVIFSNPLSGLNDDFTSSDDESLSDEDVTDNHVLEDIENKESYVSNLNEPVLLVIPLSDAKEDEFFDPGGDIDEIDAFLDIDISMDIEDDHDPRSLKDEPDNDDLKSMVKVFNPEIHEKIISPIYVRLTFEDRHYLSLTYVIRIFFPYLTYSMDSLLLLSFGSEDTIFDPGISYYNFHSLEPVAYESPIMIFPFFCFCPKVKGIREIPSGEIKVKRIENKAKTGIFGFVSIKFTNYSRSKRSQKNSPSMPLERALKFESSGALGSYWANS